MFKTFNDRDEFKRKAIAEKLISLFESDIDVSPTILDGQWGSGKTEFCTKLINLSVEKKANFGCIYIDAFKYDHSDDSLLMLITEVSKLIEDPEDKKKFFKESLPVLKVLGKAAGKAAISIALRADAEKLGEQIVKAIDEGGEELLDLGIKKAFEDYEKIEENLNTFRKTLKKIAEKRKILILIDELDRCRPVFALSLLEKIKHVFNIEGVNFLFATNLKQLSSMVRKQYGNDIDAERYLSKFFHYTIKLPNEFASDAYTFHSNSYTNFYNLIKGNEKFAKLRNTNDNIGQMLSFLFKKDNLSLRDTEKFYRNLQVLNEIHPNEPFKVDRYHAYTLLNVLSVYIYTFDSDFTEKILFGHLSSQGISKFFEKSPINLVSKRKIEDFLYVMMLLECDGNALHETDSKDVEHLKKIVSEMLQSGGWHDRPDVGDRLKIIQTAIKVMQLSA